MTSFSHPKGEDSGASTSLSALASAPPEVSLRALRATDRLAIRRWMRDPAVINFTVVVPGPDYEPVVPYDTLSADRYLELLIKDPSRRSYAIVADGVHVGNVGLKELDLDAGTSECFIEVGAHGLRRRGVGAAAMRILLGIAFDELGLQTVRLGVFDFNTAAIALYRKVGFVDDGDYGQHFTGGRYHRILAMRVDAPAFRRRDPRG